MAMKRRSATDIRRLQEDRRKHPQSRYRLETHERRELEKLVIEQGRPVDADMVKNLSTYFVVTQGTIMQNLEGLGINTDLVAQGTSVPKPEPKTAGRPTLHLGGKKTNKKVRKTKAKDLAEPEGLDGQALKEEQNKLRLAQVQLQQREAEVARKLTDMERERAHWASVEAESQELEQLMADQEERHQEELAQIKRDWVPTFARNADAEPVKLYTSGQMWQVLSVVKRDFHLRIDGLTRTIASLEAELQDKEAQGRTAEWHTSLVDSMQVM